MVATARMVEQGMVVLLVLTSSDALSEPLGAGARPVHSIRDICRRIQRRRDKLVGPGSSADPVVTCYQGGKTADLPVMLQATADVVIE
jgi:hypothetical protein